MSPMSPVASIICSWKPCGEGEREEGERGREEGREREGGGEREGGRKGEREYLQSFNVHVYVMTIIYKACAHT